MATANVAVVIETSSGVDTTANNNHNNIDNHDHHHHPNQTIPQANANAIDRERCILGNDALPKISKTKIRLGSNRRALKLKRFQAQRVSMAAAAAAASTKLTVPKDLHHNNMKDLRVVPDSSSSSSSLGSLSLGSSQTKHSSWVERSRTPSATTSQRLVNSIVLTSDTFSILCDINAHRWIVDLLNLTSLASPSLYVPSTHHYTFGSVHDLSHRLRKHSNKSEGAAFVLLKSFYLDLKARTNGLFASEGEPSPMSIGFDPQKGRKLSTALGDLSMINNISRAPTLIIAPIATATAVPAEFGPNKSPVTSGQHAEDFAIALDREAPAGEVIDEPQESHATRTSDEPSCVSCHSMLVSLASILLVMRYLVHFVLIMINSNVTYYECPLVVVMLECCLSLVGTVVVLVKRDSLEDLIVSSASFLKPLALWQRSFVKHLPRAYFAFWLALLLANMFAFLAAELNVQLGQWQWNRFWTEVWPLDSGSRAYRDCSVDDDLDSYELDKFESVLPGGNKTAAKSSLNVSLVLRQPRAPPPPWPSASFATLPYVSCCARLQRARVGSTWIYLVYLDQLLRTYIAYNLLLIKTFYFSLLLVMLFKCSQLCTEVLSTSPSAAWRVNRSGSGPKGVHNAGKRNRPCPPRPRQITPTTTLTSKFATQPAAAASAAAAAAAAAPSPPTSALVARTVPPKKDGEGRCHFYLRALAHSLAPNSLRRGLGACTRFVCHHRPGGTRVGVSSDSTTTNTTAPMKPKTMSSSTKAAGAKPSSSKVAPLGVHNHQESERLSSLIQVLLDNIRAFDRVAIVLMAAWAIISTITLVALWKYTECFWRTKAQLANKEDDEDLASLWAQFGWLVLLGQLLGSTIELVCFVVAILWLHIYRRRLLLN